jgi:ribonuclease PH
MALKREDGRAVDELRPVKITPGFLKTSPGSVLIEMGDTKVICTVSVEDRVPPFLLGKGKGWLTAEYSMLPGSSKQRVSREGATGRINSRAREIQRLIGRSLRSIIALDRIGERTLYVDCDVIQADGGTRTASITGSYVALVEAIKALSSENILKEDVLLDGLAAVSVGMVDDQALLDLCYREDSRAQTDMNVVMTGSGGIVEIQGTAEGKPFSRDEANVMLDRAARGIEELQKLQDEVLQGLD